jgi:hypothetical protein
MENTYKDVFKIVAPGLTDSKNRNVVRTSPRTYDRLRAFSEETGVSICRIVDQCVDFAFERLERDGDAE